MMKSHRWGRRGVAAAALTLGLAIAVTGCTLFGLPGNEEESTPGTIGVALNVQSTGRVLSGMTVSLTNRSGTRAVDLVYRIVLISAPGTVRSGDPIIFQASTIAPRLGTVAIDIPALWIVSFASESNRVGDIPLGSYWVAVVVGRAPRPNAPFEECAEGFAPDPIPFSTDPVGQSTVCG